MYKMELYSIEKNEMVKFIKQWIELENILDGS